MIESASSSSSIGWRRKLVAWDKSAVAHTTGGSMNVPFVTRIRWNWPSVLAAFLVISIDPFAMRTLHARLIEDPERPVDAAKANARPKVLPTTERILKETSVETIEESIDHLDSMLDWALASAPSANVRAWEDSYEKARSTVPRLNRVRKLLAQIDDAKKEHYAKIMLQKIKECNKGFAESRQAFRDEINRNGGVLSFSKIPPFEQKLSQATALVYLLTEMERTEAIPVFADLLEQREPSPVNHLFLLYSCHLLLEARPTDGLSATQSERLRAYHDLADKFLPIVERKTVTAWNAKYNESDFRAVILGEKIPIDAEPTIKIRTYPELNGLESRSKPELTSQGEAIRAALLGYLRSK